MDDKGKAGKLGIFGSRSLFDENVRLAIYDYLSKNSHINTIVTCQEPRGVSEVAQRIARDTLYRLEVHFLNPHRGRGAFHERALRIIESADEFLVIHDGVSKGTANELELLKKSGKKHEYIVFDKSKVYDYSTEFNITDTWDRKHNYNDVFEGDEFSIDI
ncbi:MAG: hypothetical protein LBC40_04140 [Dysgonamonadaceae bacterium]|jgi:hypothetical protein|nr:hypothetical protein [Dysgonamonadaceae bacterium]